MSNLPNGLLPAIVVWRFGYLTHKTTLPQQGSVHIVIYWDLHLIGTNHNYFSASGKNLFVKR